METPVRKGGTGQIARLLGLRNLYRFPKYFLAPRPIGGLRTHRRVLDHPQTDSPKRTALHTHTVANGGRGVATIRLPALMGRRPGSSIPDNGRAALVAKRAETDIPNAGAQRPEPPIYRPGNAIRKIPGPAHTPRTAPIGEAFQTSINRYIFRETQTQLSQTAGLAPPRPAGDSSADLGSTANLRAVPAETVDPGPVARPPVNQPPFASRFGTTPNPASSSAQHSPAGSGYGTSQGPRTGTLHIDGAALGRWTVQHLERTLGKPSAGMTGVDPRATIPRSRVAPF